MRKIILALAMLVASSANAAMIRYELMFVVDRVSQHAGGYTHTEIESFFVGDTFYGSLLVDDSILATDGAANAGMPRHLRIKMGDTIWAQDFDSELAGLRGPCYNAALACSPEQYDIWGLGSEYLGFEVVGGAVAGLWGGVFGLGDEPYVDFNGTRFIASPYRMLADGIDHDMETLYGSMTIRRIPVSSTLALMGLGLLLVARHRKLDGVRKPIGS